MGASTLRQRLLTAWGVLRGNGPAVAPVADDARLAAEAATAALRLQLQETQQQTAALRRDLDAARAGSAAAVSTAVAARLEPALADAAARLGQLALQARLLEEGKPIAAADVMALAQALARALERTGLIPLAAVGDRLPFNPDQHQPLHGPAPAAGSLVVVRIPGYQLDGKTLRKTFVETIGGSSCPTSPR
jgi:molecular chaperone GrpE (heat shock protein)